jgi:mRNA interferase MazF
MNEKTIILKQQALTTWSNEKIQLCTDWINDETNQRNRSLVQKGIYLCKIGENIGGEINSDVGRDRPVLVISNNRVNDGGSNIIIVPLTKRLKTIQIKGKLVPKFKTHYFLLQSKYDFLTYDSTVKTEDIRSTSKIRITRKLGEIDTTDFNNITRKVAWMIT